MYRRPEAGEDLDERVVLGTCAVEVDRVQEAMGRIVEGGAKGGSGSLDEDFAQGAVMLWAP